MLRNYAKLCVKEGVVSDRVNTNNDSEQQKPRPKQNLKHGKKNPFEKAELLAKNKLSGGSDAGSNNKDDYINTQARKDKEIKQAAKKRKETSKIYQARTKKGQPYLSKISSVLLAKISAQMK